MNVRRATAADLETVRELWTAFYDECPEPEHRRKGWGDVLDHVRRAIDESVVLLAEHGETPVGFSIAWAKNERVGYLSDLYVVPDQRRRGIARALLRETERELGCEFVTLTTELSNAGSRAFYRRLGFREESINLVAQAARLSDLDGPVAPSFGSVHVQTDDSGAVARAVRQYVPRLPGESKGTVVSAPRSGWVAVYDELCDREPPLLARLARELSDRMGAVTLAIGVEAGEVVHYRLLERGRIVDEYVSVPEYHGPLPPGDVIALGANPTVVARLTGADPKEVRAVARTAAAPTELPPAPELLEALTRAMGLEGAEHGYDEARELEGAEQIRGD